PRGRRLQRRDDRGLAALGRRTLVGARASVPPARQNAALGVALARRRGLCGLLPRVPPAGRRLHGPCLESRRAHRLYLRLARPRACPSWLRDTRVRTAV